MPFHHKTRGLSICLHTTLGIKQSLSGASCECKPYQEGVFHTQIAFHTQIIPDFLSSEVTQDLWQLNLFPVKLTDPSKQFWLYPNTIFKPLRDYVSNWINNKKARSRCGSDAVSKALLFQHIRLHSSRSPSGLPIEECKAPYLLK